MKLSPSSSSYSSSFVVSSSISEGACRGGGEGGIEDDSCWDKLIIMNSFHILS